MTGIEGGIVGAAVFLALGAFKLLERSLDKRNGKNGNCGLTADERRWLGQLHEWHDRHDADGVPLWFLPRRLMESQGEMLKELRVMNQSLSAMASRKCPRGGKEETE